MNDSTLKSRLRDENTNEVQRQMLIDLWDTLMDWGGYEGYYTKKELSYKLGISNKTLNHRLKTFKEHFPEAYEVIRVHRNTVKATSNRLNRSLTRPVSYNTSMDKFIVEKY